MATQLNASAIFLQFLKDATLAGELDELNRVAAHRLRVLGVFAELLDALGVRADKRIMRVANLGGYDALAAVGLSCDPCPDPENLLARQWFPIAAAVHCCSLPRP